MMSYLWILLLSGLLASSAKAQVEDTEPEDPENGKPIEETSDAAAEDTETDAAAEDTEADAGAEDTEADAVAEDTEADAGADPIPDSVTEPSPPADDDPVADDVTEPSPPADDDPVADDVTDPSPPADDDPVADDVTEPSPPADDDPVADDVTDPSPPADADPVADDVTDPSPLADDDPVADDVTDPSPPADDDPVADDVTEPSPLADDDPVADDVTEASPPADDDPVADDVTEPSPPADADPVADNVTEPSPTTKDEDSTQESAADEIIRPGHKDPVQHVPDHQPTPEEEEPTDHLRKIVLPNLNANVPEDGSFDLEDALSESGNSRRVESGAQNADSHGVDESEAKKASSTTLAGILCAIGVAAVGAVTGYFTYQRKQLCFKNRQAADPEAARKADAVEAQSDPQALNTLLNSEQQ